MPAPLPAPTLTILAAGLGSRFGGPKQLAPVGPGGESLLEYLAFDAVRAGFTSIVVVVHPDSAGSVRAEIEGVTHELAGARTEDIVSLGIALVPEGRRLFPRLSVEENLTLGAYRPAARAALRRGLEFCFEAFPRLAERRRQLAGSMSGGEQQMLALGRALMSEPRILLVDEPSVGLAPLLVKRTIEKIRELKESRNLTVLMAEQNFVQALSIADRGYVIVHGEIAFAGNSAAELNDNELIRKFYMGL